MVIKTPDWIPAELRQALAEMSGTGSAVTRARIERMGSDPRLQGAYAHLGTLFPDSVHWRAFLTIADDAAYAVTFSKAAREHRKEFRRHLVKVHNAARRLSAELAAVADLATKADLFSPLEFTLTTGLIERAAGDSGVYLALAADDIRALGRLREDAIPGPESLAAALADAAQEALRAEPEEASELISLALRSRKWSPIGVFVQIFDSRWDRHRHLDGYRTHAITHSELAQVAGVAIGMPETVGPFKEAVRSARTLSGWRFDERGFEKKSRRESSPFTLSCWAGTIQNINSESNNETA